MPRKVSAAVPLVDEKGRRLPFIRLVKSGGAAFATVDAEHPFWKGHATRWRKAEFVRIRPPHDATDHQIDALRGAYEKLGALDIQVQPRPRAQVVVDQATVKKIESTSIRATVEQMVREANSHDPNALGELVQSTLARVGL